MRVEGILRRLLGNRCRWMHAVRFRALVAVAGAIAMTGRLSLSAIGRGLRTAARAKHAVKRVDRLLGNPHLVAAARRIYAAIADVLLVGVGRPIVLVDWTQLTGRNYALVAAVPLEGRAVPIYIEVHPIERNGTPTVEARFLRALRDVLPPGARPIIVTDAGFRRPFFETVLALKWDFVGRLRGRRRLIRDGVGTSSRALMAAATTQPEDVGEYSLSPRGVDSRRQSSWRRRHHDLVVRLVRVRKQTPRRRPSVRWTSRGILKLQREKAKQAAKEPWLLATSLTGCAAEHVVWLYALRMSIEETFRDMKNERWGWHLHHIRSRSSERLDVLMLALTLALVAAAVIGRAAFSAALDRGFQANTTRRRVFSLFVIAGLLLRGVRRFPSGFKVRAPDETWWITGP